ncbi:phosphoglycerate mutase-like protein [Daedalea quercina L-15889]|uniref:Phosphoglycerate mutase-like protein n=1 Tax=Daedalea quercina L-15889 TaxID=1314783 RepID=A0A165UBB2_9APHY|nr:phosphoglycerate mutase-like protein [Daedalea quercina L-15889]
MVETIFIARHGFRMNWVTSEWESVTGLPRDPPLAAFGLTQAQELADHFLSFPEDQRPTLILSSPYYRCLQTATPTSQALQVPIFVEHGLSEWYSPVVPGSGLHPRPASATVLRTHFPDIDDSWSSIWYPSRKGEDVDDCLDRCHGFLSALLPEIERRYGDKHERILLVSHAAPIIALARELLGDRRLPLRVGCCTVSEFTPRPGGSTDVGAWQAKRLADGSLLKEGALRDWGFEDIQIANGKVIQDPGQPGTEKELDEPVGLQPPDTPSRM